MRGGIFPGNKRYMNMKLLNGKTLLRGALLAGAVVFSISGQAALAPYPELGKIAVDLLEKLERRHYSKHELDDAFSSLLLDSYLKRLDPGRHFFYRQDIEEFETWRYQLDNQITEGNLAVGFLIFNRYHERIEQRLQKLVAGLPEQVAAMDFSIDETISLQPEKRDWPASERDADERWRKQVKNAVLRLKLAGKAAEDIVPTLKKRYQNQQRRVSQYNAQDVFQIYANALTALYDPHTNYLSPRNLENFNISMSLSLEGIGAALQLQDEYTQVVRIVPAGPADKQGKLQANDRIVAVGQDADGEWEDVVGWRLDDVVQLIRGPKGTTVRLEVIPAKSTTPDERRVITLVRNEVKLAEQSAQKDIVEIVRGEEILKLGVLDIPTFYIDFDGMHRGEHDFKSTTRDVKRLLDELVAEQVDGVIVDLRNNGGGSLQEANDLIGLFIEYGPTVQIRHSSNKVFREGKRLRTPYYDGPLLVLMNRLSASASEIYAGAIQDYQRGLIVGTRSFGKGTVQTLLPLVEGQIKLTESKFYRISGESTQHRGVIPDVTLPARYDPTEIGESTLDYALNWDQINPVVHRKYHNIPVLAPQLATLYRARVADNPDFIFLQDSLALAADNRARSTLPLQEAARFDLQARQKAKSLAIGNKRRQAKGLPPLTSETEPLAEDSADSSTADAAGEEDSATAAQEPDILLLEAAQILADMLLSKGGRVAATPS